MDEKPIKPPVSYQIAETIVILLVWGSIAFAVYSAVTGAPQTDYNGMDNTSGQ